MIEIRRIEKLTVQQDAVKTQAAEAVVDSAVKFKAVKNKDGTWTIKKEFILEDQTRATTALRDDRRAVVAAAPAVHRRGR